MLLFASRSSLPGYESSLVKINSRNTFPHSDYASIYFSTERHEIHRSGIADPFVSENSWDESKLGKANRSVPATFSRMQYRKLVKRVMELNADYDSEC